VGSVCSCSDASYQLFFIQTSGDVNWCGGGGSPRFGAAAPSIQLGLAAEDATTSLVGGFPSTQVFRARRRCILVAFGGGRPISLLRFRQVRVLAAIPSISADKWIRLVEIGSIPHWETLFPVIPSPHWLDLQCEHHDTSKAFGSAHWSTIQSKDTDQVFSCS